LLRAAQPRSIFNEYLQHRPKIECRAADDLEDLSGRGLLLQRLGKISVASLQLLKQPHVLNRDDRLVGEGLEQVDFIGRERAGTASRNRDPADRLAVTNHGD
jgi:hypothetical protein